MKQYIFALGFFDGVHLGHKALLDACVTLAEAHGLRPAAITFQSHPQSLWNPQVPGLLTGLEDRQRLLEEAGMEKILVLPVTAQVMGTPWETFLEGLLEQGAGGFVCGDDFRFGREGRGDREALLAFCRERGIPCVTVPEQVKNGVRVSSTHIRSLLAQADVAAATEFLGHFHRLTGQVVPGRQLGRTMGIPTANVAVPEGVLTPGNGVYACRAQVEGKTYAAVTNVGMRPTVEGHHVTVEPWLLDFQGDLYGKTLTLEFVAFLRPERKFDSLEVLRREILHNAQQTRTLVPLP